MAARRRASRRAGRASLVPGRRAGPGLDGRPGVRLSRREQAPRVVVGSSATKASAPTVESFPFAMLVSGTDMAVRVSPPVTGGVEQTVSGEGLCASTGKVVDFRNRDHIAKERPEGTPCVPLVYVGNFPDGVLTHPLDSLGKGQWFLTGDEWAKRQTIPAGSYVVVRRFSAKEERRRVVAYPLVTDCEIALENHSSYIHAGTPRHTVPLQSPELARGLATWLNSTLIDDWFRGVSGSTQVNARDIKAMPCPDLSDLESLGQKWHPSMAQDEIDRACKGLIER